jgi:hypothetical protein
MRRLLFLFALALAAPAFAKDPPAGRPAFDPTLLTRPADGGLVCARPADLMALTGAGDDTATAVVAQTVKAVAAFVDGDLKAENLPAASAIEQVVVGVSPNVTLSTDDEQGTFGLTGGKFGYVRTVDKFDWAAFLKATFPKATAKGHAGREYTTVGVKLGGFELAIAFFVPDDRTLVFDCDPDQMEAALAKWGKAEPKMPAGWDDVKGCAVAFVFPMGDRKWMTVPAKVSEVSGHVRDFVNGSDAACLGVSVGDEATLVGVFTASSADAASTVEGVVNKALTSAEEGLDGPLAGKVTAACTKDGKTVRVEARVKADAVKEFIKSRTKEYEGDGKCK